MMHGSSGNRRPVSISAFDVWVGENNPPPALEHGKGLWDYVETVRRMASKFEATDERVIGTYIVRTPPPEEKLPMPAVAMDVGRTTFALKFDFGADSHWPKEWIVSVRRQSLYRRPLFHLFNETADLSGDVIAGFGAEWTLPSYRASPSAFTCELEDQWDVAMLIRLLSDEA